MAEINDLMTYEEAAEFLRMAKQTLYNKICQGVNIPHYRLSKKMVLFDRNELEKWLRSHRIEEAGS